MTDKISQIMQYCNQLKLAGVKDSLEDLVLTASKKHYSYEDFSLAFLEKEILHRRNKDLQRRLKEASLPLRFDLDHYDFSFDNGLTRSQLNQLRELTWLDKNCNIILMGPPGVGKTFIAAGLCYEAVKKGYKAYFKSIEQVNNILKMRDVTKSAQMSYQKISKSHLLAIDDIMLFSFSRPDAVKFFHLVDALFEKASFIITTNKNPQQWSKLIDDEVLTTAILDRILYRCEIIKLTGKSFRLSNRKKIFEN